MIAVLVFVRGGQSRIGVARAAKNCVTSKMWKRKRNEWITIKVGWFVERDGVRRKRGGRNLRGTCARLRKNEG